jgi:hypothetical protein
MSFYRIAHGYYFKFCMYVFLRPDYFCQVLSVLFFKSNRQIFLLSEFVLLLFFVNMIYNTS